MLHAYHLSSFVKMVMPILYLGKMILECYCVSLLTCHLGSCSISDGLLQLANSLHTTRLRHCTGYLPTESLHCHWQRQREGPSIQVCIEIARLGVKYHCACTIKKLMRLTIMAVFEYCHHMPYMCYVHSPPSLSPCRLNHYHSGQ